MVPRKWVGLFWDLITLDHEIHIQILINYHYNPIESLYKWILPVRSLQLFGPWFHILSIYCALAMAKLLVFSMIVAIMLIVISGRMVEAVVMCYVPSQTFHGNCKTDPQGCKDACISEGFNLGPCKGFIIRKCVCFKDNCSPPLAWNYGNRGELMFS